MMTSQNSFSFLVYLLLGKMAQTNHLVLSAAAHQDIGFISHNVGDNVTFTRVYSPDDYKHIWYKQTLGQKPKLMCILEINSIRLSHTFYNEFKQNPRFSFQTDAGLYHLSISDVQLSDSATYICVVVQSVWFEFKEFITVSVEGSRSNVHAVVRQSESQRLQPGGSVTLSCTVHAETCDGEHSVYWLKNSQEPLRGILYTKGDRRAQCKRKNHSQTHTCVHKLPIKSLNLSDAGIYYCAVAACGQILFGNGTKVDFKAADELLVYLMSGALTFTTLLSVFLSFLLYKRDRGSGSCARSSAGSTTSEEGNGDKDSVHYAALSVHLPNRPRRQMDNAMS